MNWCWDAIDWGDASGWAQAVFSVLAILFSVRMTREQMRGDAQAREADIALEKAKQEEQSKLREGAAIAMLYGDLQLVGRKIVAAYQQIEAINRAGPGNNVAMPMPEKMPEVSYLTQLEGRIVELRPTLCAEVSDLVSMLRMLNEMLGKTSPALYTANQLRQMEGLAAGTVIEFGRTLPKLLALHPNPARFVEVAGD